MTDYLEDINNAINQHDLLDHDRSSHQTAAEYQLFIIANETLSNTDDI